MSRAGTMARRRVGEPPISTMAPLTMVLEMTARMMACAAVLSSIPPKAGRLNSAIERVMALTSAMPAKTAEAYSP
jgi:hypothetical protein